MGFWGFCYCILYRFENRWVFGVFGVFATSYFVVLRNGGVFGVFGVFAASYLSF